MKIKISKSSLLQNYMKNISFTEEEKNIISLWQSSGNDGICNIVNSTLYGNEVGCINQNVEHYIEVLTAACDKFVLDFEITVKRGEWGPVPKIGAVLDKKGFLSTSLSRPFNRPVTYIISVPKGTHAIYIKDMAANKVSGEFEDELLIQKGYKLKINSIDSSSDIPTVYADLVLS